MGNPYELDLARRLEHRMARLLADAQQSVVPPGTLGTGLGVRQTNDTGTTYDPVRGVLTITGVVKIDIHGVPASL